MALVIMIVGLLVLLALRVPVAISLLVPSLVYVTIEPTANLATAAQQFTSGVNDFALLAVPLFILLGNLANESGISDRLYNAGVAWIGHVRGSLGYVNIGTSFGFSWMSGAAIADAAAMGRVQVPAMVKRGYPRSFSLGITGASSLIAPMIPPQHPRDHLRGYRWRFGGCAVRCRPSSRNGADRLTLSDGLRPDA